MNRRGPGGGTDAAPTARSGVPPPRPLFVPALALCAGIWLADASGLQGGAVLAVCGAAGALLVGLACWPAARRCVGVGPLAPVACGLLGFARYVSVTALPADHVAHLATADPVLTRLAGRLVAAPQVLPAERRNPFIPFDPQPRTRFVLAADGLLTATPPMQLRGLVRVSVTGVAHDLAAGDRVELAGWLSAPVGRRNPGEPDWQQWQALQGIHAVLSVPDAVHVGRCPGATPSWRRWLQRYRNQVRGLLLEPGAEQAPDTSDQLLDVVVFGQRSAASRQLNEVFVATGTVHFLAVSGFHVGVLAAAAWWLGRRLWPQRHAAAWLVIGALAAYALLVEPNAPALRAALVGVLAATAVLLGRPWCPENWLALAAGVLLVAEPRQLFQAGFQLSFVQVLVLLTIVPHVARWWPGLWRDPDAPRRRDAHTWRQLLARRAAQAAVGLLTVSVVAWLWSAPLVLHHFGRFAPLGFAYSMLVTPVVVVAMPVALLAVAVTAWHPALGAPLAAAAHVLADGLAGLVQACATLPGTAWTAAGPPAWLVGAVYVLTLGPLLYRGRGAGTRWMRGAGWVCAAVAVALWLGWLLRPNRGPDVGLHVLSVGNGLATAITLPDGRAAVYDVGTISNTDAGATMAAALRALGMRRVESVTLSHANFDHYSGLPTLLAELSAAELRVGPQFFTAREDRALRRLQTALGDTSPPRRTLAAGDELAFGPAQIAVLWPPAELPGERWAANDVSLVLRVTVAGRRLLLTGDVDRPALRRLLELVAAGELDLRADVLVAPHHGRVWPGDTAALLAAVRPELVIVSTGEPRPAFADLAGQLGTRVLSTDAAGAVSVWVRPGGALHVTTARRPPD